MGLTVFLQSTYPILLGSMGFDSISSGFIWLYWVLLGFTGFLVGFTGFYWVLLGF